MNNIFHVIKDPVHGTMQFTSTEDKWIKPFVDSPTFQRLRHIKQLGMEDFIFPGAVHTRFNHCLGCCYVGSQIAQKIGLPDVDRQLVMIACLLHDIGHGPFSHAFEDLIYKKSIRHEEWTPYFLNDYGNETFFQHYNHLNPQYKLDEEKFAAVADMIMHKATTKRVLADIVSSQLDADRLDYLLRDSHFCGVRYGEFDFRWMLHCMVIVASEKGDRLGITHKGIGVVEHYLMARRLMMRNLYQGQKKLALEFFLIKMLGIIAENMNDDLFTFMQATPLGKFLFAVKQFNQAADISDAAKHAFLHTNYPIYKELCDYDIFSLIRQLAASDAAHPAIQLAKRLQYRHLPKVVRFDHSQYQAVQQQLQAFKANHPDYQDWQITLMKTPHRAYSEEEDPIFVLNEQAEIRPLGQYSEMINAMSDKFEHISFLSIDQAIMNDDPVQQLIKSIL